MTGATSAPKFLWTRRVMSIVLVTIGGVMLILNMYLIVTTNKDMSGAYVIPPNGLVTLSVPASAAHT